MSYMLIDDQDSRVIYSEVWDHELMLGRSSFNGTLSRVSIAGQTATLNFVGLSHILKSSNILFTHSFFTCRFEDCGIWLSRLR